MTKEWWVAPFLLAAMIFGFLWLLGDADIQDKRIEREFKAACAKANGIAVWNKKYWECLK